MTRNRDIKELERTVAYLEDTISENARYIEKYTGSILTSASIIENLNSDLAEETNIIEQIRRELNALKTADIEDKERLDVLRETLDVMKNGLPEPGKAFLNQRHGSEKKISDLGG